MMLVTGDSATFACVACDCAGFGTMLRAREDSEQPCHRCGQPMSAIVSLGRSGPTDGWPHTVPSNLMLRPRPRRSGDPLMKTGVPTCAERKLVALGWQGACDEEAVERPGFGTICPTCGWTYRHVPGVVPPTAADVALRPSRAS